ncbi:hypothetical protein B0H13DRAFT_289258 [Mycena leptocephala]|nr:hypothetical protein B0H13DRAFT_289258 [Mycena leptocephala]
MHPWRARSSARCTCLTRPSATAPSCLAGARMEASPPARAGPSGLFSAVHPASRADTRSCSAHSRCSSSHPAPSRAAPSLPLVLPRAAESICFPRFQRRQCKLNSYPPSASSSCWSFMPSPSHVLGHSRVLSLEEPAIDNAAAALLFARKSSSWDLLLSPGVWRAGGVLLSAAEAEAEWVLGDLDGAQEGIRDGMRSHEREGYNEKRSECH